MKERTFTLTFRVTDEKAFMEAARRRCAIEGLEPEGWAFDLPSAAKLLLEPAPGFIPGLESIQTTCE